MSTHERSNRLRISFNLFRKGCSLLKNEMIITTAEKNKIRSLYYQLQINGPD
uniref:Uncharacterized protein n=1 Tax=Lepeophtheirus salmonis TaxID=72036 RepID=A0A0K2T9G3_LEPSM